MSNSNKKFGEKNEKKAAKKYNGTTVPASGALWIAKGDISTTKEIAGFKGLLIQNKKTKNLSFSIKKASLKEIEDQALEEDKLPVFRVELGEGTGYITLPEWVFELLIRRE